MREAFISITLSALPMTVAFVHHYSSTMSPRIRWHAGVLCGPMFVWVRDYSQLINRPVHQRRRQGVNWSRATAWLLIASS